MKKINIIIAAIVGLSPVSWATEIKSQPPSDDDQVIVIVQQTQSESGTSQKGNGTDVTVPGSAGQGINPPPGERPSATATPTTTPTRSPRAGATPKPTVTPTETELPTDQNSAPGSRSQLP